MFFDLSKTTDLQASLSGLALVAAHNPDAVFDISLSAEQVMAVSGATTIVGPDDIEVEFTQPDTPAATPPAAAPAAAPAADKPKTIRRNAEEMAAELTVDQARERRELGLSVDEYLAQQEDPTTPAASAPAVAPAPTAAPAATPAPTTAAPELNTAPTTAAETLAQQPAMSAPPTGEAGAATVEDIRQVVGVLIAEGKEDAIRLYTEKLGVPKLSAADPSQYGAIVAYLKSLAGPASDDLV